MNVMKTVINMRTDKFASCVIAALSLALSGAVTVSRADENHPQKSCAKQCGAKDTQAMGQCLPADKPTAYNKVSSLIGMTVRNPQGEELGTIKDLVVDFQSGQVSYAVLARRTGLLGTTEKLFAVPLNAFSPTRTERSTSTTWPSFNTSGLVLNADKKSLETAQGFPSDQWPSVNNPSWGAAPVWKENSEIQKSTTTAIKGANSKKITHKEIQSEPEDKNPPGSLGYPGW